MVLVAVAVYALQGVVLPCHGTFGEPLSLNAATPFQRGSFSPYQGSSSSLQTCEPSHACLHRAFLRLWCRHMVLTEWCPPDVLAKVWLHKDQLRALLTEWCPPDVLAKVWLHKDQLRAEALPYVARHCRAYAKLARHICNINLAHIQIAIAQPTLSKRLTTQHGAASVHWQCNRSKPPIHCLASLDLQD